MRSNRKFLAALVVLATVSGCTFIAQQRMEKSFGREQARDRIVPIDKMTPESLARWEAAKNVLDSRCVVCHSCYDAPCQLKLTSARAIERGSSGAIVYDSARLTAAEPTRLGIDRQTTSEWRKSGFSPVVNERDQTPAAHLQASVLYRLLKLKRDVPLPPGPIVSGDLDFTIDRKQVCAGSAEMDRFEREHPLWGMPFGFPPISDQELSVMTSWIENGAVMGGAEPISEPLRRSVNEWETFLNAAPLKNRLMSRYVYEHLFLGDLIFDQVDSARSFKLVRSRTGPGEPVSVIPSRRPSDDPGVEPFFYRIVPQEESAVAKTEMPYPLNPARMIRYRELFLSTPYSVTKLPPYDRAIASNPFKTFEEMPPNVRYRFMLDDAQFFVSGFIKGPVCRGQVALNVINDQFWVFFVQPELDPITANGTFLAKHSDLLSLPAESGSTARVLVNWRRYSGQEKEFLSAKRQFLSGFAATEPIGLSMLWNGNGTNTNAALTVFRHYDSATVVRGLVGDNPKTAWVLGYPLFERIHYLLVAEFDIFGNLGHQLLTRLYMDFLRIEAENNFLMLLPKEARAAEHASWYRGVGSGSNEYALEHQNFDWADSGVVYRSNEPKRELYEQIRSYLGASVDRRLTLSTQLPAGIRALSRIRGIAASNLPEMSILRLKAAGGSDQVYTLIANRSHENVGVLYLEKFRRLPHEDSVSIVPGSLGAYPNAFFSVAEADLGLFAENAASLQTEADYRKLLDRFGVRRTDPGFWSFSDWLHAARRTAHGDDMGRLDYSRFENR